VILEVDRAVLEELPRDFHRQVPGTRRLVLVGPEDGLAEHLVGAGGGGRRTFGDDLGGVAGVVLCCPVDVLAGVGGDVLGLFLQATERLEALDDLGLGGGRDEEPAGGGGALGQGTCLHGVVVVFAGPHVVDHRPELRRHLGGRRGDVDVEVGADRGDVGVVQRPELRRLLERLDLAVQVFGLGLFLVGEWAAFVLGVLNEGLQGGQELFHVHVTSL
jgi:hypothetical protein